jgi:hypothetical protein
MGEYYSLLSLLENEDSAEVCFDMTMLEMFFHISI